MQIWSMVLVLGAWGGGAWQWCRTLVRRSTTMRGAFRRWVRSAWRRAWSRIPGTPLFFRRLYLRQVRTELRKRMHAFRDLDSLNAITKDRVYRHVRSHQSRLVMVDVRQRHVEQFFDGLFFFGVAYLALLGIPLIMAVLLIFAPSWIQMNPINWPGWSDLYTLQQGISFTLLLIGTHTLLVSIFTSIIVFIIVALNWIYHVLFPRYRNTPTILISVEVVNCLFLIYVINGLTNIPTRDSMEYALLISVSFGTLLLHLVFLSMRPIAAVIHITFRRRKKVLYPDAMLIGGFLTMLHMIEKEPQRWSDTKLRQSLTSELEDMASCLQVDLPQHLRGQDAVTDLWFTETMEQAAATIRGWKRWVLTPKADTRAQLLDQLATSFVYVVEGQWDSFERTTPEKLSRPQWWHARVSQLLQAVQGIVLSVIPLVLVWVFQQTPLALSGSLAESVIAVAYLLSAVGVLAALDPRYSEKVSTIKTIVDLFPLLGKNKTP